MPQAELKFSSDLALNAKDFLVEVEATILAHDRGAGPCKGRGFAIEQYHHTHALLDVLVLDKPHRDDAFMTDLTEKLTALLDAQLPCGCARAVSVGFLPRHYVTGSAPAR